MTALFVSFFFFQAEDGIRDWSVTGVQTCALPISSGLLASDVDPTQARLIQCIFTPGFSTATKVTPISGRGVGMDVVRSDIAALRSEERRVGKEGRSRWSPAH